MSFSRFSLASVVELSKADSEFVGRYPIYGIRENLDLTFLNGTEVLQFFLGQHRVQFHFHPVGDISVEGDWELLAADGSELDRGRPSPRQ